MVCCSRSTKPLVQAWRGLIRVWRMPSAVQASSKLALNSPPPSVNTRWSDQPARRTAGSRTCRKKWVTAVCASAGKMRATPYELAAFAGRDLPDLADALELADVKGVQADQLARALGDDVPRLAVAQAPEGLPRALGEQAGPRGTVMLEHQQALTPRRQAMPPQQALHSARRHAQSPEALRIGGQAGTAPRGFRDRDGQQASLDVRGQLGHRSRSGLQPARMHAIDPVAFQPAPPAGKHGARDPYLAARRTDADHLRPLNDVQPHSLYALVQGHRSILPKWSLAA